MIRSEGEDSLVLQLSGGRELVIKMKQLKRYKRYRDGSFYGVYNDEASTENHEIWIESTLTGRENVITQIHEIMHFVNEVGDELDDPGDYDGLARYIYQLCVREAQKGEDNE